MGETEASDRNSKKRLSSWWVALFIGLIIGMLAIGTARFITFKPADIHYHANFALYINGQQDEFKSPTFYEEVAACDVHDAENMKARVHMHDNNSHLIHVHASGITWGQFFANLRYSLSNTMVQTDNGVFLDGTDGNKLTFVLNGRPVDTIANQVIHSEDVLLINYGKDDQTTLTKRYDGIPRDAHKANTTADPAACTGNHHSGLGERMKYAIGFGD